MKLIRVNRTDIQSLGFDKSRWTLGKAEKWLKEHGFIHGSVDSGREKAKYWWFRQFNTKKTRRYRSIPFGKTGAGIMSRIEFAGAAPRRKAARRKRSVRRNPPGSVMRRLPAGITPFKRPVRRNPPPFSRGSGTVLRRSARPHDSRSRFETRGMTGSYNRPSVRENPRFSRSGGGTPGYPRFRPSMSRFGFRRNPGPYLETRALWQHRRGIERRREDLR